MVVTILGSGTSQGVPLIDCGCAVCSSNNKKDKRLRSSALIQTDDIHIVIDSGPDFRQQMLREKVRRLDAIVYTHQHKDHIGGVDDVRGFNYSQKRPMPLYGRKEVLEHIKSDFYYAFEENAHAGLPKLELHLIDNKPFKINNTDIIPIEGLHHKLLINGYRIHDFAYLTDMKYIYDAELEKLRNVNILIINALQIEKHISHFNLEEALLMIEKIGPKRAYVTHIGHRLGFYDDVSRMLPSDVWLCYDGLRLEV